MKEQAEELEDTPCMYCGWAMGEREGEPLCDRCGKKGEKEMRIEIWEKDQKEEEQPLRLRLVQNRAGSSIVLRAVNKFGGAISEGSLLTIDQDGRAIRCSNINPSLGLMLNDIGELKC